jgi:hypothetical protein
MYNFYNFYFTSNAFAIRKVQGKHLFSGHKDIPEESRIIYWDYIASYLKVFQAKMAH